MPARSHPASIALPNGDELIPDTEFLELVGGITSRTGKNWDEQGCPFILIGGRKWRPKNEGLSWVAGRIQRRNPRRRGSDAVKTQR
jgi:hypothetical protein